ncbi:MAG: sugar phosphate isomerase/epimerase [Tepidisphaeraceae bacterium]
MPNQLAAQMYTLREFTKTPADIAKTMQRVRDIGYTAIQRSAFGPVDPKDFRKMLDDNGLACCATHVGLEVMRDNTQQVIDEHKLWGCELTAIGGYFPKAPEFTLEAWQTFIKGFNAVAEKFKGSGLRIGYHNHSHELAKIPGTDQTAYAMLVEKLTHDVWIEVDTYWIQHGGGDPAWWIDRVAGRLPAVHLKDLGMKTDRTQFMMEVGQGNLNWDAILAACKRAGTRWYIVEQDTCYRDPFESLKISYEFLASKGLK